jgi:pilus assembly protein Flp/PilA
MLARLRRTTRDDQGASAVEYGLLVAAIAAVIVVVAFAFGGFITDIFQESCNSIAGDVQAPGNDAGLAAGSLGDNCEPVAP